MKLFGKSLNEVFKPRSEIIKEQFGKPVETIQDLEDFYNEIHGDYGSALDYENGQWVDAYLEEVDTPKENRKRGYKVENIADDVDPYVDSLDQIDLGFIVGKKGWVEGHPGREVEEEEVPVIENENLNTPEEALSEKDKERNKKISKKYREEVEQVKAERLAAQQAKQVPQNLPVESPIEAKREKPVVKIELEEKPIEGLERFKLLKQVLTYNKLIKDNVIEKLRPRRGDVPLTLEQVKADMKKYEAKIADDPHQVSKLEKQHYQESQAWVWAVEEIEGFNDDLLKTPDGKILSDRERAAMVQEYFDLQRNNPDKYARMQLELFGESQVEQGKMKKGMFAWQYSEFNQKDQWIYDDKVNKIRYVTQINPNQVAPEGEQAKFFYKTIKEIPNKIGKTVIVNILVPQIHKAVKNERSQA